MDTAAKLEQILGRDWQTLTAAQVETRAVELEKMSSFARLLEQRMQERRAGTVAAALGLDHEPRQAVPGP